MRMRDDDGHHAMLKAGKAWKRVRESSKRLWSDWTMEICPGLVKARAEAQSISNNTSGKGYNTAMSALLEEYGLDDMDPTARKHALDIMEFLPAVERWRAKQPNRERLNHPTTVWRLFEHSAEYQDERIARGLPLPKRKDSEAAPGEKPTLLEETAALQTKVDALEQRVVEVEQERDGYKTTVEQLRREASPEFADVKHAIAASPQPIALWVFVKSVRYYLKTLEPDEREQVADRILTPLGLVSMQLTRKEKLTWEPDGDGNYVAYVMEDALYPYYFLCYFDPSGYGISFTTSEDDDDMEVLVDGEKEPLPLAKAKKSAETHHKQRAAS